MAIGLVAPAAITVEVKTSSRRVFRLTREVGESGLRLERPAPFEIGEPVDLTLQLPDAPGRLSLRAVVEATGDEQEEEGARGGCGLAFVEPPFEARQELHAYVRERLGLPPPRTSV